MQTEQAGSRSHPYGPAEADGDRADVQFLRGRRLFAAKMYDLAGAEIQTI